MKNLDWLQGIFCAAVTPIREDQRNTLDEEAFEKVLEHLIVGKVDGIVVLGSSGEFPCFSKSEKEKIIKKAVEFVNGRVPIVIGTGSPNIETVIEEVNMAKKFGAQAALVTCPYYYPINQSEIEDYYKTIAEETDFPIIIYNIPGNTKVLIDYKTVAKLSCVPNIVGIKDTTRDFLYLQRLIYNVDRKQNNFKIFLGTDILLLAGFMFGVDGVISITCNLDPSLDVDMWKAYRESNLEKALEIEDKIMRVFDILRSGTFPASLKGATSLLGLTNNIPCYPVKPLNTEQMEELRQKFRSIGYDL